jgi:hypothetical protein
LTKIIFNEAFQSSKPWKREKALIFLTLSKQKYGEDFLNIAPADGVKHSVVIY